MVRIFLMKHVISMFCPKTFNTSDTYANKVFGELHMKHNRGKFML